MLKANNQKGDSIISWKDIEARETKGPFFCPECKKEVIFIDAILKIKHFRHKTESSCEWEPETDIHIEMKRFFMERLGLNENNLEIPLGFGKPDIYDSLNKIAIEVQHSNISREMLIERTKNYSLNGIYVLWIFDISLLKNNVPNLLKKAHEIYFGRVYLYEKEKVFPVHFKPKMRYVEEWGDYGGYYSYYKKRKDLIFGDQIKNFSLLKTKNNWKGNDFLVARFYDKMWWANDKNKIH